MVTGHLVVVVDWGSGAISIFTFQSSDIVLVGTGSCARVASKAAVRAGAQLISLRRKSWPVYLYLRLRGARHGALHFDQGDTKASWVQFGKARDRSPAFKGPRPRVFLAGAIPKDCTLRPDAIDETSATVAGVQTRRIFRDALVRGMIAQGLEPTSLRERGGPTPVIAGRRRKALSARLAASIASATRELGQAAKSNAKERGRPRPPRDQFSLRHESAISSALRDDNRIVVIHKDEDNPFDLAVVDLALMRSYARAGIKMIVVAHDVYVLDRQAIRAFCAIRGLDFLYTDT